eukprot:215267-Chlamydomonas_euryale.AAC.7
MSTVGTDAPVVRDAQNDGDAPMPRTKVEVVGSHAVRSGIMTVQQEYWPTDEGVNVAVKEVGTDVHQTRRERVERRVGQQVLAVGRHARGVTGVEARRIEGHGDIHVVRVVLEDEHLGKDVGLGSQHRHVKGGDHLVAGLLGIIRDGVVGRRRLASSACDEQRVTAKARVSTLRHVGAPVVGRQAACRSDVKRRVGHALSNVVGVGGTVGERHHLVVGRHTRVVACRVLPACRRGEGTPDRARPTWDVGTHLRHGAPVQDACGEGLGTGTGDCQRQHQELQAPVGHGDTPQDNLRERRRARSQGHTETRASARGHAETRGASAVGRGCLNAACVGMEEDLVCSRRPRNV